MSQILSQNEVDALLAAVTDGRLETTDAAKPETEEVINLDYIKFDFTRKRRFVKGDMPTADLIFMLYAKELENFLTNQAQQPVTVNFVSNEIINYNEYVNRLPVPIGMYLIDIPSALCKGIMSVETQVIYHLLNIFFGGRANLNVVEDKNLTEIELQFTQKIVQGNITKLEEIWNRFTSIEMKIIKVETDPNYISVFPSDELILLSTWELDFNVVRGNLNLVLSLKAIETLEDTNISLKRKPSRDAIIQERMHKHLKALDLEVTVDLGQAAFSVRELLGLQVGDVIPIETDKDEKLLLNIEGNPKFLVNPGAFKGKKAVKIHNPIKIFTAEHEQR
ncbi:MAG: hypothetical protein A2284_05525 [Deltaproteobacteria bacterium RIFOXYA12_FULL_61_11]|nr:MAG: hypothetical protein A2284_05525 [Deltaproteobacteria bacterium RIFOXYA12_FULL_61_11]